MPQHRRNSNSRTAVLWLDVQLDVDLVILDGPATAKAFAEVAVVPITDKLALAAPSEQRISLDVIPNGAAWDGDAGRLVIADFKGNRLATWSDAAGLDEFAELPVAPAGVSPDLGQPLRTTGGQWMVPRFGHGTAGTVFVIPDAGAPAPISNLDPARRRMGMAQGEDGSVYVSWFVKAGAGRVGGLSTLDEKNGETDIAVQLTKPVGVVVVQRTAYVSDQDKHVIATISLDLTEPQGVLAAVQGPDFIVAGPSGSLLATTLTGEVLQISLQDGKVETVGAGMTLLRGVAFDEQSRRIFALGRESTSAGGYLWIRQISR